MADIIITLTSVGADQGPLFDLYSNTDGFTVPFETDVAQAGLQTGYTTTLAPEGTTTIKVCGQGVKCANCADIPILYTTTTSTTLPPVGCEELTSSGGVGVTEYQVQLEEEGGVLVFDFNAYGVTDKFEIIHNNIKVATTGMTVPNEGPFDDVYGDPTVPADGAAVAAIDQFIGTAKSLPPTREADIALELGTTYISEKQQLIWWEYDATDVLNDSYALIRVTGPTGTAWDFERYCGSNTTTTTTTAAPTTTTTTTVAPPEVTTTTTTTTNTVWEEGRISITTDLTDACSETVVDFVWIDVATTGIISVGDTIYTTVGGTNVFVGNGDYYKLKLSAETPEYSARVTMTGEILTPITTC